MQANSPLAFDELPRGNGGTGATAQINKLLNDSDIDVPASLYDEALAMAREGRLAPAAERLRMLLVLDATDANAAMLLGKVQAGRGQWQEALAHLDMASSNGAVLPVGLREEVESNLQRQVQDAERHRQRVATREQAEIRGLRQEAKRLRSDNASLEIHVDELSRRVKLWTSMTAIVAGSASALLVAVMLFGSPEQEVAETPAAGVTSVSPEAAVPTVADEIVVGTAPQTAAVTPESTATPSDVSATEMKVETVAIGGTVSEVAPVTTPDIGPKGIALPTVHVVEKGNTLGAIAKIYYGKSSEWRRILNANDATLKGSVTSLQPGMELVIPAL